jgi:hypothetical protein
MVFKLKQAKRRGKRTGPALDGGAHVSLAGTLAPAQQGR